MSAEEQYPIRFPLLNNQQLIVNNNGENDFLRILFVRGTGGRDNSKSRDSSTQSGNVNYA